VAGLHATPDASAAWALTYDWRAGVYLIGHNQDRHTQVEVWGCRGGPNHNNFYNSSNASTDLQTSSRPALEPSFFTFNGVLCHTYETQQFRAINRFEKEKIDA
jgi:hypothetical protein